MLLILLTIGFIWHLMYLVILPTVRRPCFLLLLLLIPMFASPLCNKISSFVFLMIWFGIWFTWDFETCIWICFPTFIFLSKQRNSTGELYLRTNLFMTLQLFLSKISGISLFPSSREIFQNRSLLTLEMWRTYCKITKKKIIIQVSKDKISYNTKVLDILHILSICNNSSSKE